MPAVAQRYCHESKLIISKGATKSAIVATSIVVPRGKTAVLPTRAHYYPYCFIRLGILTDVIAAVVPTIFLGGLRSSTGMVYTLYMSM